MSFADEMKDLQKNKLSDQEEYNNAVKLLYEKIKHEIRCCVNRNMSNLIEGICCVSESVCVSDTITHSSALSAKYDGDGGYDISFRPFCDLEIKKGLFSNEICIRLTDVGKRVTEDLKNLARMDSIELSFYPRCERSWWRNGILSTEEVKINRFGVTTAVRKHDSAYDRTSCFLMVHYRIPI